MGRETSMSAEQNKAIALRASEIVNQKNPDLIEECYPPDFVWHGPDQDIRGYEQAKQMSSTFLAAFPDAQITDEDVIAEGEKVVRRYTTHATHQGETEMFGPPTGRQIELKGITIHRIEGGKIVEEWESFDNLSMMKQLGLAPEQ
jgi:predicted ester cyclase